MYVFMKNKDIFKVTANFENPAPKNLLYNLPEEHKILCVKL